MLISKDEKLYRLKTKRQKLLETLDSLPDSEYIDASWELEDIEIEIMDIEDGN